MLELVKVNFRLSLLEQSSKSSLFRGRSELCILWIPFSCMSSLVSFFVFHASFFKKIFSETSMVSDHAYTF